MDRRLKIPHSAKVECGFRTTPEEYLCDSGLIGLHIGPHNTLQYNTLQYNTIQYSTIQYNTIQYNTIQHNTVNACPLKRVLIENKKLEESRYIAPVAFLGRLLVWFCF